MKIKLKMNLLKIKFIKNFIKQRKLKIKFEIINSENNLATKILNQRD